jgi:CheY-like chemotaxis protein
MRRILIADDSPAVRRALAQLLAQDHLVIEVADGQAAFTRSLELRPDLIILDLAMPVMDGLTAAREISGALPEVPILMYTMHWTPSLEVAAKKVGIRRLVPKTHSKMLLAGR